jgi:tetratricopeptide (TPR) repeat protein
MSSQVTAQKTAGLPGKQVAWPVRLGVVPPLAGAFSPRPETGLGLASSLVPGETTILCPAADGGTPVPLAAAGGTGKTQLAAALAHSLWQAGAVEALVWLTASCRDAVMAGYAQALHDIGAAEPGAGPGAAAARFLAWLASTSRPWLIVLDDLADPSDLEGLWPQGPAGHVVVTSRQDSAALRGEGRRVVQIGVFSRREALSYLNATLYDDPDQRIEALDLAEDLRCLPLALAQAAALMADQGLDCRAYRVRFADRKRRLAGSAAGSFSSIAMTTWSLSLDYADQFPPAGLARPALALTALLDPNGIPGAVLTSKPACDFMTGRPAADDAATAAAGGQQARSALQNLARLGLVTIDPATAERTVRVHPMVGATIREALPPAVLKQAAQAAAAALQATWPAHEDQPMLAQALRDNTASLRRCTGDLMLTPENLPLLIRAGRSLEDAQLTGPAIGYWLTMIDSIDRAVGPGQAQALAARDHLAAAYDMAGQPDKAISAHGRCVEERERILGPEHPDTLTRRGDLAHAYLTAGRLAEAIPIYERTLAGREWVLGPDHPDTLTSRGNLAFAYSSAGRLAEAIAIFQRTLADRERILGPDHPDTLAARGNLAAASHSDGRLKEAIPLYQRTLADRERILGSDHPDTLTSCGNLAYAYRSAGKLKDAIPLYKRTVAGRERILGPDHPDTLAARGNLAAAYHTARRLKDAVPLYERTLADRERVQGQDHPDTVTARGNLAAAYHSAGRMADAVPLYERTLADCERVRGPHHQDTLTSRCNLAHAYHTARRQADAIAVFERTLADCERVLEPGHPLTQTVRASLEAATQA